MIRHQIPTKEDVIRLYLEEKKTQKQVAEILRTSVHLVRKVRMDSEIRELESYERKYPNLPSELTEDQKSIIVGSLLGDGILRNREAARYPMFRFVQSRKHHGYVRWMKNRLAPWITPSGVQFQTWTSKTGKTDVAHVALIETISHPTFLSLWSDFYSTGKKLVPKNIFDLLTPLALAVWYMDDGSSSVKGCPMLCTYSFSEEEHVALKNVLENKFSIPCRIGRHGQCTALFPFKNQWFDIVGSMIWKVACMRRKLPKNWHHRNSSQNQTPNTPSA